MECIELKMIKIMHWEDVRHKDFSILINCFWEKRFSCVGKKIMSQFIRSLKEYLIMVHLEVWDKKMY